MTLPLVPGVAQVAIRWTIDEDNRAVTKLYYRMTGGTGTQADLNSLASSVASHISTPLQALVASHVTNTEVDVFDLSSAAGLAGTANGVGAGNRTSGASYLPAQVALVANYRIARRYRGGKPRSYWPAGTMPDLADAQRWQGSQLSAGTGTLYTLVGSVLSGISAATGGALALGAHCNVSYYSGGAWHTGTGGKPKWVPTLRTTPVVDDVISYSLRTKLGTQRRRAH